MSKKKVVGFVEKKNSKTGQGRKGPWTVWSLLLKDSEGDDIGWISCGFDEPQCEENDHILLFTEENARGYEQMVKGSLKVNPNPPKAPEKPVTAPTRAGSKDNYNGDQARHERMYHASRGSAIELIQVLVENDGLPLSAANTKGNKAKRFEEITQAVDKMTVRFFRDESPEYMGDFRLLSSVEDAGKISPPMENDLPDQVGTEDVHLEEFTDDFGDTAIDEFT